MVYLPYLPQGATQIYPETMAQELEGIRKPVTARDNLEKAIAIATLPSKYHPSAYDNQRGVHLRDETWMQFIEWRKTGEDDQTIDEVQPEKSIGIMIPTQGVPHHASIAGVKMSYADIQLNMRDVGKYVSKYWNFKHDLTNYLRSSEGQALAAFLNKAGLKADDIDYIGVGFLPESAIYAVGRLANGKRVILSGKDAYKQISEWACREGTKPGEVREAAIGEEITHLFRNSKPSIREERATKTMLMNMYQGLLSAASNPALRAKYNRIIRHLQNDIATVERYAKEYSGVQDLVSLFNSDVGKLEAVLEARAIDEGINSLDGVRAYVSKSLEAIAKAAGKDGYAKSESKAEGSKAGKNKGNSVRSAKAAESADGKADYAAEVSGKCAEGSEDSGDTAGEGGSDGGGPGGDSGSGSSGGDGGGSSGE